MAKKTKRVDEPDRSAQTEGSRAAGGLVSQELRFTRVNAVLGAAGAATLALGYYLLSQGSITAAPLLLVLAYVILIPLAIIL